MSWERDIVFIGLGIGIGHTIWAGTVARAESFLLVDLELPFPLLHRPQRPVQVYLAGFGVGGRGFEVWGVGCKV